MTRPGSRVEKRRESRRESRSRTPLGLLTFSRKEMGGLAFSQYVRHRSEIFVPLQYIASLKSFQGFYEVIKLKSFLVQPPKMTP